MIDFSVYFSRFLNPGLYLVYFSGFQLSSERMTCKGPSVETCSYSTAEECAYNCKNASSKFSFGRKDSTGCETDNKCECICWHGEDDGSCSQEPYETRDLYTFTPQMILATPKANIPSKSFNLLQICVFY